MCAENQQNSSNVEGDTINSECAAQVSVIKERQKEVVRNSEQSFCTENYTRVLKSVNLYNLCDSR